MQIRVSGNYAGKIWPTILIGKNGFCMFFPTNSFITEGPNNNGNKIPLDPWFMKEKWVLLSNVTLKRFITILFGKVTQYITSILSHLHKDLIPSWTNRCSFPSWTHGCLFPSWTTGATQTCLDLMCISQIYFTYKICKW